MNFYKGLITTLATCLLIIGCGKTSDPSGIVDLVEDEEVVEDTEIVEDEVIEEEEVEEEEEEEEVPVFTWINMLLVVSVLIGYYFKRR